MDIVKWRESYATGISSMDTQHKKVIELINLLYNMIVEKEPSESINKVLSEMNQYAELHLREEEELLKNNEFPEFSQHRQSHSGYRKKTLIFIDEAKNGNQAMMKEMYSYLRKWWLDHILTEDMKYGEFLRSKGIK